MEWVDYGMKRVLGIYGREDIMWWLWSDLGSLKSG